MELRKLNRNMIELAVIQGIREIHQDPNRGMRRMTDLAQHFAEKNFHDSVFLKIQAALLKKDSRYYQMIRNIINQVDENAIRCFGMNLGYNSWTCGITSLREIWKKTGKEPDWYCELYYDGSGDSENDQGNLKKLESVIDQKKKEGVYCYFLYPGDSFEHCPNLVFLLSHFPDCAFFWFFRENHLTEPQIKVLKRHTNCMYLFPAPEEEYREAEKTAYLLRKHRILHGMYMTYKEEDGMELLQKRVEQVMKNPPLALVLKAEESVSEAFQKKCAEKVWAERNSPHYDTFLVEMKADNRKILDMILGR